jgi:branched-chain amino acid transport system permease protein
MPVDLVSADVLTYAGLNGLLALGLYAQMRVGMLSVASGTFLGIGALTAVRLNQCGIPFLASLIAGAAFAGSAGLAIAYPCQRLRSFYLAVATLAFSEVYRVVAANSPALGGSLGLQNVRVQTQPWHVGFTLLAVWTWLLLHQRSVAGLRWDSVREAETPVAASGIDVGWHRLAGFCCGSAILGLGGGLWVHYVGYLSPDTYGYERGVEILLFVCLLGIRSAVYPVVGAGIIVVLLEGLRPLAEYRFLFYGFALVVLTVIRCRDIRKPGVRHMIAMYRNLAEPHRR